MSSYVYCLYSTEDGAPRYVGRAADKVAFKAGLTPAAAASAAHRHGPR